MRFTGRKNCLLLKSLALRESPRVAVVSVRHYTGNNSPSHWQNGTPEIIVGTVLLLGACAEFYLQGQETTEKERLMMEMHEMTRHGSIEDMEEMEDWLNRQNPLFDCTVRRLPLNMDGYKCIQGVKVGDVVEILEEKVGPEEMYNLCRTKMNTTDGNNNNDNEDVVVRGKPISAGWFPTMCLEKVEHS